MRASCGAAAVRLGAVGGAALVAAVAALAPTAAPGTPGRAAASVELRATRDASVSAAHPRRRDPTARSLRVGGKPRWRTLLRFRVRRVPAGAFRATLHLFARRAPGRRITVRRLRARARWRERRVTARRAPRLGAVVGRRRSERCRRRCGTGRWLSIGVTVAVRGPGVVQLAVTGRLRHTLRLAGRRAGRHAPRLRLRPLVPTALPESPPPKPPVTEGAAAPVVAAAGDIACPPPGSGCEQAATSDAVLASNPAAILLLGDNQYETGTLDAYRAVYDPTWGRFKAITYPVPGNHEYGTAGATGYFDYFNGPGNATGPAGERGKGWYGVSLGGWRLLALNSNCADVGGCGPGSAQETWLRRQLADHPAACTLAFFHHPRFSSGPHGSDPAMQPLWQALHDGGADVVLGGHDHHYERFAPQSPSGAADPARGLREFVVGTGGRHLRPVGAPEPNSEARDDTTYGVLLLRLSVGRYDWRFARAAGGTFTDAGSASCH
jgi:hypothetical protein